MLTHSEASPELVAEASGFSNREDWRCGFAEELCLKIVQVGRGRSGRPCKEEDLPSFAVPLPAWLFAKQCGYHWVRSYRHDDEKLRSKLTPRPVGSEAENKQFLERCSYVADLYDGAEGRQCLAKVLDKRESK